MSVASSPVRAALMAAAVALVAFQWRATRTENVNWDEFAFLSRAGVSAQSGKLQAAGRPGLAVLMLVPFARNCANSVAAVVAARQLWLAFTVVYLIGVFYLVRSAVADRSDAWIGATLAVALIALVPVFLRWSLQVRTDQPALMFATWGGVALLAATRRTRFALPAGALFELGYLCTQKAAYVGALILILFVVRLAPDLRFSAARVRRGLLVLAIFAVSVLGVGIAYRLVIAAFYELPPMYAVESALNTFAYYRAIFGYRAYWAMMPTLGAHIVCLCFLVPAMLVVWSRPGPHRAAAAASWIVLMLGLVVGAFHGGAFPYFWMTLGLFPAVAIGIGWSAVQEFWKPQTVVLVTVAAVWLLLASALPGLASLQHDTQRVQRDALAFIDRNFPPTARGFQAESALFCRPDPQPFPTYFAESVTRRLLGPNRPSNIDALINEFRTRPVQFIVAHRLFRFPEPIDEFWNEHYALYKHEVLVPGRTIEGHRGDAFDFDVIAPGTYRWTTVDGSQARLVVDGNPVSRGSVVVLERGIHRISLPDDVSGGLFTLAMTEDPAPAGPTFYAPQPIHEIDPHFQVPRS